MVGMGQKDSYVGKNVPSNHGILTIQCPVEHGTITNWDKRRGPAITASTQCAGPGKGTGAAQGPTPAQSQQQDDQVMLKTSTLAAMQAAIKPVLSLYAPGCSAEGCARLTPTLCDPTSRLLCLLVSQPRLATSSPRDLSLPQDP